MRPNPNCDGGKCISETGEVRLLPHGEDSNLILCHDCFNHEINYRKARNRELADWAQFNLPTWDSLEIYGGAL